MGPCRAWFETRNETTAIGTHAYWATPVAARRSVASESEPDLPWVGLPRHAYPGSQASLGHRFQLIEIVRGVKLRPSPVAASVDPVEFCGLETRGRGDDPDSAGEPGPARL